MSRHTPEHQPSHDEEHPQTAADEILHEVEDAEARVGDDGRRRKHEGEAADALTPNEGAQEDVQKRDA
ncbi:hypothetical protein OG302_03730 [Streptomyces sp. NBC_01283]|uniref:hypothetical protein n=1 Tax=Streptomyces sp. NBC_01283 TaxID=2903812 RepID=UPI00352D40D8|nr:hypothetical protein OG302_03730 [Streptomyces sp. NBC_01283]